MMLSLFFVLSWFLLFLFEEQSWGLAFLRLGYNAVGKEIPLNSTYVKYSYNIFQ